MGWQDPSSCSQQVLLTDSISPYACPLGPAAQCMMYQIDTLHDCLCCELTAEVVFKLLIRTVTKDQP